MNLPSFPNVDLFSAGINALNGVLVARNPSHNRGYAVAGLLIMALFGGIGGGISRDLLLNNIPSPIQDPRYFVVCLLMGLLGLGVYRYAASKEERFRTRTLAFFKSFTLPWFAVLGAHKALDHGLGLFSALIPAEKRSTLGKLGKFIGHLVRTLFMRDDDARLRLHNTCSSDVSLSWGRSGWRVPLCSMNRVLEPSRDPVNGTTHE